MTIEATQAVTQPDKVDAPEAQEQVQGVEEQSADPKQPVFVIAGEDGTPTSDAVPLKKYMKLKAKLRDTQENTGDVNAQLAQAQRERDLLKLQLEQGQKTELTLPTLEAYEYDEAAYASAMSDFYKEQARGVVKEELGHFQQETQQHGVTQQFESNLDKTLERHDKEADDLGITDYAECLASLTRAVGVQTVPHLLNKLDAKTVYFLHKNELQMEKYAAALRKNPVDGLFELAELKSRLRPAESNSIPGPDAPLEGGAAGGNSYQVRLDYARKKTDPETGKRNMTEIIKIKREAEKAGVKVS